jgi:hypothetical protein
VRGYCFGGCAVNAKFMVFGVVRCVVVKVNARLGEVSRLAFDLSSCVIVAGSGETALRRSSCACLTRL